MPDPVPPTQDAEHARSTKAPKAERPVFDEAPGAECQRSDAAAKVEPMPVFSERRRYPRRSAALTIRYRRIDPHNLDECEQEYRHGLCRNLSEGGMLLEVEGYVSTGQVLELYASDRNGTTLFGIVETVRATRTPDHYEVGVRFLRREDI